MTRWLLFQGISCYAHLALIHCLKRTFIYKFVHHYFWLKLLQELRYLLWFILINLISCDVSQSIWMFWFFLQWVIWLASHQKHYQIPPPQVEIIYICVCVCVKSYKSICFTWPPKTIWMFFFTLIVLYTHNTSFRCWWRVLRVDGASHVNLVFEVQVNNKNHNFEILFLKIKLNCVHLFFNFGEMVFNGTIQGWVWCLFIVGWTWLHGETFLIWWTHSLYLFQKKRKSSMGMAFTFCWKEVIQADAQTNRL
jgi:hypothetical protein